MASAMQGRGSARVGLVYAAVLTGVMSVFLEGTDATQWIVGDASHWSYLHANAAPTFYQDWAANKTFQTGDTLQFEYDNTTHTVLQLATAVAFAACDLNGFLGQWKTGNDSVFISKAGTYYYVCGAPSHCQQGMKFSITATGNYVAPPPGVSNGTSPTGGSRSLAAPGALRLCSGAVSLVLAVSVAAILGGCV